MPLDVHLMITDPDRYIEAFVEAGAAMISVHVEVLPHLHRTLHAIKALGAKAGVVLNPATPVAALEEIAGDVDYVLVMSVNPGFGGQTFIPRSESKIRAVRALLDRAGSSAPIEVDGGIDLRQRRARRRRRRRHPRRRQRRSSAAPDPERATRELTRGGAAGRSRAESAVAVDGASATPRRSQLVRVRYAETDKMGVVYYANYFVWFEVGRTDCCARSAGAIARWKSGRRAAGDRGALRSITAPARYDDELEMRTTGRLLSPVRVEFTTRWCGADERRWRPRPHRARGARRRRPAVPAARARAGGVRMKALVTGAAGFIGSHLTERAARPRRRRSSASTASPTTTRARSRKRNLDANRPRPGFRFVETRIQDADLPALLDGVTHVFHLAAQAGVRKSWGRDFQIYTDNNIEATQRLLEACVGPAARAARLRLELVGLRRQRRDADARGRAAAAGVAVRRDEAGGRAALLPLLRRTTACRRRRCAISRCTARGSGPTWASTGSSARRSAASRSRSTATASRPATSRSSPTRSRRRSRPATRGARAASTILAAARASR